MLNFNYSKYNPRGLTFGGACTWKEFSVTKVGSKTPWGLYTVGLIIGILRYTLFYENNEAQICPKQHLFRISRLHTEFYNFLYKWILAGLNLAN